MALTSFLGTDDGDFSTKSYEDFYSENSDDVEMTPAGEELDNDTTGVTPSGRSLDTRFTTTITGNNMIEMMFGSNNHIFGLPFNYTPLADPLMRVYENTLEADANICYIQFGTPRINRALFMKLGKENNKTDNVLDNVGLNIISSLDTTDDHRLISFKPNFNEFYKYASVTANYLYTMMDLPGLFDWDESFGVYNESGVPFFCVKTTSVNESVDNSYEESEVTSQANSKARESRINYQMYGTYGDVSTPSTGENGSGTISLIKNIATGLAENLANVVSDMPVVGSVASVFMNQNRGSMQFYAKLWADSSSGCSYSISFKFATPYGNKMDIFRNVYFPFSLLYTASIPRQNGKYASKEPFLVKICYPG